MLEFFESDGFQVIAEDIAEEAFLFWDVEHDDMPETIPFLRTFDLECTAEELLSFGKSLAIFRETERNGTVWTLDFFEEL